MKVAVGCDHAAVELREAVIKKLKDMGKEVLDFGTHTHESVDYPDFGQKVSRAVQSGEAELGVLICGTGIGMSIVANKFKGIRAALCSESFSARMSRRHNNANVLVMGARTIGVGLAEDIVETFFSDQFEGGRHARRVDKITVIEEKERS
jgi:ribose 5-phosphate isomerase B